MRLMTVAAFLTSVFCFQACFCGAANAQVGQAIADYHGDRVFRYQPNDPWKRSRMFNRHTGNGGLFYNCDGEQSKRNSPYICWKPHIENDFPPIVGLWGNFKRDVAAVRQRVLDGSCCDPGCGCGDCQTAACNGQTGGCAQCVNSDNSNPGTSQIADSAPNQTRVIDSTHGSKFGLVQGKIIQPPAPTNPVVSNAAANEPNSMATNQSILEQLRSIRRR